MVSEDDYHGDTFPPLSLWQVLRIAPHILALPFAIALGVFHENEGRSWRRAAHLTKTRYLMGARAWTPWELKSLMGATTAQAYASWARKNHVEVLTDELPEGGKLHWIGPRREDRVILHFHGGGLVLPAREATFEMLASLQKDCKGAFGIAFLSYSLVPEYPLPTQLRQATAAVQHLLDKGMSPSNIIIAGDSAGGNIALQLASLLLHPHPSLPLPPTPGPRDADASPSSSSESQQPFGGLLLISPCVEFSTDWPSYVRNSARDCLPVSAYQLFGDAVRPGITPALRCYVEPVLAPRDWWTGLGRVFPRVLVTAGEHEMPLDQIQACTAAISKEVRDTTMFVLPGGVHEDFVDAFASGEGGRGDDYKSVVSWLWRALDL